MHLFPNIFLLAHLTEIFARTFASKTKAAEEAGAFGGGVPMEASSLGAPRTEAKANPKVR